MAEISSQECLINTSILHYEKRNTEVATPTGTPSPPMVTSTVARDNNLFCRKKITGPFERFVIDECDETVTEVSKTKNGKNVNFLFERSSLGLLNPDSLENFTFAYGSDPQANSFVNLYNNDASLQLKEPPPNVKVAEEQAAAEFNRLKVSQSTIAEDKTSRISGWSTGGIAPLSTDNSTETVIAKNATKYSEKSYSQGSPSDETISAVNCALPLEYLVPTPNVNSTSTNMNFGISYFLDSTCDTGQDKQRSSGNEFPSGVQPMTPYWDNRENFYNPHKHTGEPELQDGEIFEGDFGDPLQMTDHLRNFSIGAKSDAFVNVSFGNLPPQSFGLENEEGNFVTLTTDQFKEFMDAEEEKNALEFRFLQEEEILPATSLENQNFSLPHPKVDVETLSSSTTKSRSSQETVSLSDYFREGTSNIGCSLEHSNGSARSIKRPDFGLSVLKSPLRRPVKVIEETLIENHNSLNESLEKKDNRENNTLEVEEKGGGAFEVNTQKKSPDLLDPVEMVSFLEETVCRTLSDKSILDPSLLTLELVAEIIRKSTNGLFAREYAERVLNAIHSKISKRNCENCSKADSPSSFLPSFLNDDTQCCITPVPQTFATNNTSRNVSLGLKDPNRSNLKTLIVRHSSPKKSQTESSNSFSKLAVGLAKTNLLKKLDEKNRIRKPLGEITHIHVPSNLEDSADLEGEEGFPFHSDHSSLLWMNCITSQSKIVRLKNVSSSWQDLKLKATCTRFSFREHGKTSISMRFKPLEVKKVELLFSPSSDLVGWTFGALRLLSQSDAHKCLKTRIPLQAHCGHPGIVFQSSMFSLDERGRRVFKVSENTSSIDVMNVGKTSGFVLFPKASDDLVISPSKFVLSPGETVTVRIAAKPNFSRCHFCVLHGSEVTRMVFRSVTQHFLENRELLDKFDNEGTDELDQCDVRVIKPHNVKPFYTSVENFKFEIIVDNSEELSGLLLSAETRFFPLENESMKLQASERVESFDSVSKEDIYLQKSLIEMSVLNWKSSTFSKIVIKNKTSFPQALRIIPPQAPFHVKISEVTVQPKHFMSVRISFKPKSENPDSYEDILIFENVSTKAQLCCKLFGKVLL